MLIQLAVRDANTHLTVLGRQLSAESPSMEVSSTALLNTLRASGNNATSDIEDLKTYLSRGLIEIYESGKQVKTLADFDVVVNDGPSTFTALPAQEFVLRPNNPLGTHDNVYTDWETLYAAASAVEGPKRYFFDFQYTTRVIIIWPPFLPDGLPSRLHHTPDREDRGIPIPPEHAPRHGDPLPPPPRRRWISDIVLPAGDWDLGMNAELIGSAPMSVPNPKLVFSDGCKLTGVSRIRDLPMYSASSQSVFQPTVFGPSFPWSLKLFGESFLGFDGGSAPAVQWGYSGSAVIDLFDTSILSGPSLIEVSSGGLDVRLFDASFIDSNVVAVSGGSGGISIFSTGAACNNPQAATVSQQCDPAHLMFYAWSGSPADWVAMPVDALEAINRLASAVAALRGTPIP